MLKKILCVLLAVFCTAVFCGCGETAEPDFSQIQMVCELATLECYYHNTSESTKKLKILVFTAESKVWVEYDGIVKIGIDASKLRIEPTNGNVINVYVPRAEILSVDVDVDTMTEYDEDHWFLEITTEEKDAAMKQAQEDMKNKAVSNDALLRQADERAKDIIRGYILNIGKQLGVEYEIRWLDN